jgi:Mono-functional DNA-alkylating methyl methanesulfonate N-term
LLSFHSESKLIALANTSQFAEIPATDFPGVMRSETTLAAANIKGDRDEASTLAAQVTTTGVILFDVQSGMEYTRWRGAITTADISGDSICVALKKGKVVKLRVNTDDAKLDVTFVTY